MPGGLSYREWTCQRYSRSGCPPETIGTRWTASGRVCLSGRIGLPGFDWSVRLQFAPDSASWEIPRVAPTKRVRSVRVAVPSRTGRHLQAAVHTLWPPRRLDPKNQRTIFYGFRKVEGGWELKADKGGVRRNS
jgi:hypothetical protein